MITLDSIVLPNGLWWADEMDWSPIEQQHEYSLAGSLIVDSGAPKQAGRPITLTGGDTFGWVSRETLLALKAFEATNGKEMVLTYGTKTFNVMFDLSGGPAVTAEPVVQHADYATSEAIYYSLVIKLMEI